MKKSIAATCECSRNTVTSVLKRAAKLRLTAEKVQELSNQEISEKQFPCDETRAVYEMPDYEYVHEELSKKTVLR